MVDDTTGQGDDNVVNAVAAPADAVGEALDGRLVSGRVSGKGEVQVADGRSTMGAAWQEGTPGHGVIKLCGLAAPGAPAEEEVTVGRAGANNCSPSIGDHKSGAGRISGISIAWVESPVGDTSGAGRIMWQSVRSGSSGEPIDPAMLAAPANDNATWVADLNGMGVIGCEPTVTGLYEGDTLVTWIDADGHAHGRLYAPRDADAAASTDNGVDAPEYAAVNAALGDLGPAVATPDGGRRLQVVEARPGTFAVMWLALAESGLVVRGNLFLAPADSEPNEDRSLWAEYPITDIRLPHGFTGEFRLTGAGEESADLVVTYSELSVTTNAVNVFARRIDGSGTEGRIGQSSPEYLLSTTTFTDEADSAAMRVVAQHDNVAQSDVPLSGIPDHAQMLMTAAQGNLPASVFTVAAAAGVDETTPIVKALDDGFVVAWQTPGGSDGVVQIKLTLYDEYGVPKTPVILVTDNAAADVPPAISGLGEGVAAAYVHADDRALAVKAFDGGGAQIGEETVVDTGEAGAISEIAIGSNDQDEFAVVYVQKNADSGSIADYGSIMLQRYAVATEDGQPPQLVELGRDGEHDGTDAPVQLTTEGGSNPATNEGVVGRAPDVTGLDDGELAIIWVESDGTRETIMGCVLEPDGAQVLRIDLTGLLENTGIAQGTKPTLLDTAEGDILVSWLQPDGDDGGYVVMAALYDAVGPGAWMEPDQPIRLKAFDSEPKDYSVAVSDDDGLFINVIWRQDGNGQGSGYKVLSQRYDIDGNDLGRPIRVAESHALTGEQQLSTATLAAAGLLDGQIVVVYAEQGSNGDVDLAAHIIDTSIVDETDSDDAILVATGNNASAGGSDASDLASDNTFSTGVDQEIAVNVLANETGAGRTISQINDVPITTATPVDVGSGWVQLREDGWLTVNPDAGYTGPIAFDYTVAGAANGIESGNHVTVNVEANRALAAVTLINQVTALANDVSTAADLKVADIAMANDELSTDGLSLAGLDTDMFKIVGTTLYLKAGIELDFETKPTLSVEILANHASENDGVANFTLNVGSTTEAGISDTFVFAPGYVDANVHHEVINVSASGYTTFQQLLEAGALVQAGDDVVITLNPADPAQSDKITLKGIELSVLSDSDFKFS